MAERPVLFSAPMVRAILAGTKTQTRRLVQASPGLQRTWLTADKIAMVPHGEMIKGGWQMHHPLAGQKSYGIVVDHDSPFGWVKCPYGQPGDWLWVRETWGFDPTVRYDFKQWGRTDLSGRDLTEAIRFAASHTRDSVPKWRPSIHMPRWASRITLEITGVRVERLKDITATEALAEGVDPYECPSGPASPCAKSAFAELWEKINADRAPWSSNPWVWVIAFRRLEASHA